VVAEFFHLDRQTDKTHLVVATRNFVGSLETSLQNDPQFCAAGRHVQN